MVTEGVSRRDRQVIRLLTILRLISNGTTSTVHALATRFHVRRESIYRDLKALQDVGYPIVGDVQGRLSRPRLAPEARLTIPPPPLTKREITALVWAVKQVQPSRTFRSALENALLKLQGYAPSTDTAKGFQTGEVLADRPRGMKDFATVEESILQCVEAALTRRRCLVAYQSPQRSKSTRFQFDPYRILTVHGGTYCLGKAPAFGDIITLALERVRALTVTDEAFAVDPTFDPKKYESEAFGVAREKPMTVVVHFRADQAPYVKERIWHPTQTFKDLPGGDTVMTFRAGGTFEIVKWILGWGDAVKVLRPEKLRREIHRIHSAAANQYAPSHEETRPCAK
jgi:predicted DNA-binding transcriptional regulator YafY